MTKLSDLEKLPEAATPGSWEYRATEWGNYLTADGFSAVCQSALSRDKDMHFITAANPATILALVKLCRLQHELLEHFAPPNWAGSMSGAVQKALAAYEQFGGE